ncbi:HNH endonuclease [Microscilla marina]|uniref:HNH nuclease domain-containing protein n=1 Tax=Microscilla marina ATCC 23134 TaxID=313606 RepID=A1ZEN4_MICM2|nr:HNH endonuclease [Microscilla marina]EAY30986.1 conserved hypothetical protein [Microscilla marina ATCC 23134]
MNHAEKNKKGSVAPHKPILLLSMIRLIEDRVITSQRIYLTPELLSTFKEYWELLANPKYHREISLPFFYLKSDGFWKLIPNLGHEEFFASKKTIKTFHQLTTKVAYAELDEALFQFLQNKQHRQDFCQILLDTYLAYSKNKFTEQLNYKQYIQEVGKNIVEEDFETYYTRLNQVKTRLKAGSKAREQVDEEEFIRTAKFSEFILEIYNYSCCVSQLNIQVNPKVKRKISMVEGCHIEPFHIHGNNSVNNGIPLTYTIHKAFDKGLIAIDDQYRVIVGNNFKENKTSPYHLHQFHKQEILLPQNPKYYPSLKALHAHRVKFGFPRS